MKYKQTFESEQRYPSGTNGDQLFPINDSATVLLNVLYFRRNANVHTVSGFLGYEKIIAIVMEC